MRAQDTTQPVVLKVAVSDRDGRYISGLKTSDFRLLEDGILQKISAFAEGTRPPRPANNNRTNRPPVDSKTEGEGGKPGRDQETFESIREDLDNSYTITYYPDPSNRNEGFRKIQIEIVPDVARKWRVRHRPGYRAPRRILDGQRR